MHTKDLSELVFAPGTQVPDDRCQNPALKLLDRSNSHFITYIVHVRKFSMCGTYFWEHFAMTLKTVAHITLTSTGKMTYFYFTSNYSLAEIIILDSWKTADYGSLGLNLDPVETLNWTPHYMTCGLTSAATRVIFLTNFCEQSENKTTLPAASHWNATMQSLSWEFHQTVKEVPGGVLYMWSLFQWLRVTRLYSTYCTLPMIPDAGRVSHWWFKWQVAAERTIC